MFSPKDTATPTYEELCRSFKWSVPRAYNIGVDCCDRQNPGSEALVVISEDGAVATFSFGTISQLSNRLSNALTQIGVHRGDRVAIVLPQSLETAVAHIATYKIGGVAVPLSVLFGPEALSFRLADSGAAVAIVDPTGLEKIESIGDSLPALEKVVVVGDLNHSDDRIESFGNLVESGSAEFRPVATDADDPAVLIYTSGTTGPPKGALHAHRALIGHLPGFELSHDFFPHPGDRFWTPADWAWIGGLMDALLPSWHYGVPVVAARRKGFDPEWAIHIMAKHDVRNVFLPPTALKLLRQAEVYAGGVHLRSAMSGGEVLGEEILGWTRDSLGVTVNEIYGQTEVNYVVGNCASAWPVRPGSMGRPYPGNEVAILSEDGAPVADDAVGEIAVRATTPVRFLGYWGRADATSQKAKGDWILTGDAARREADGYLWFKGRKDDIISSGGYRIGPSEIEECLIKHDAIAMAAVIGASDEIRGEVIKAFVKLKEGHQPTETLKESIRDHVRQRLASYQYPRLIEFIEDLPLTTTGKIRRADLRKLEAEQSA
ncbi:MAG: AMP-binding protein [Actinomycetota bacterium]